MTFEPPASADPDALATSVMVVPWHDPVVDAVGYDVRSLYVELFWLNVLGPTATWTLRRLVHGLDRYPFGYELDLAETASMLGLAYSASTSNSFARALQRCTMFGMAQPVPGGLAVRRRVPPVANRHLARMPESLRAMHGEWLRHDLAANELDRAVALARTMVSTGDDPDDIERQLLAVGTTPTAAAEAIALMSGHDPLAA
ncbi:MAG TPA: hypothetical protein PLV13_02300 [Ilumatobacteraceae bacterium]|nr:hypothetical protein [Ilumatobacteraceae bacterium]